MASAENQFRVISPDSVLVGSRTLNVSLLPPKAMLKLHQVILSVFKQDTNYGEIETNLDILRLLNNMIPDEPSESDHLLFRTHICQFVTKWFNLSVKSSKVFQLDSVISNNKGMQIAHVQPTIEQEPTIPNEKFVKISNGGALRLVDNPTIDSSTGTLKARVAMLRKRLQECGENPGADECRIGTYQKDGLTALIENLYVNDQESAFANSKNGLEVLDKFFENAAEKATEKMTALKEKKSELDAKKEEIGKNEPEKKQLRYETTELQNAYTKLVEEYSMLLDYKYLTFERYFSSALKLRKAEVDKIGDGASSEQKQSASEAADISDKVSQLLETIPFDDENEMEKTFKKKIEDNKKKINELMKTDGAKKVKVNAGAVEAEEAKEEVE